MAKRLTMFIDKHKILSKHQYGFRQNRSTEHAIINFVDKITTGLRGVAKNGSKIICVTENS